MQKYIEPQIPKDNAGAEPGTGILLTNLGTPDAPTAAALRPFLKEFLWDPRVVEAPKWIWWLLLNGIVLNRRPPRSAKLYQRIWTKDGSPLLLISRRQQAAFSAEIERRSGRAMPVALGMRYGKPSIRSALAELRQQNCRRILVLPLYPQYSAATGASSFDAVAQEITTWRWVPDLHFIMHYHDDPAYIAALDASARELWAKEGEPDKLVLSFHGLPKRFGDAGDPYPLHCERTAALLAQALDLTDGQWLLTYQSRFGREEWLQPYTDKTLEELARGSAKRVDVICPGFSADCLETLEEINMTNREFFMEAGGERFRYIPALNDRPDHIRMLVELALRNMQGWGMGDRETMD